MRVLISGASVAGPTLAYWLARYGFDVTVVERSPAPRKSGGHAVDLFKPAMDIVEAMGVLEAIEAHDAGTDVISIHREGKPGLVDLPQALITSAVSQRHIEIMRDDLSEILYAASSPTAEYIFGDSIAALTEADAGVRVAFEAGPERRFDLVIGADGLHSHVRNLVFGPESGYSHWLGEYLAVASIPNYLDLKGRSLMFPQVNRLAGMYSATQVPDARAFFLFRTREPLEYHHRDVDRQKALLREVYEDVGWEVPRLLAEVSTTDAFYMDSITQLRMETWSKGRITLVGDAGYCPGPAVGGSTSLAVVGAYVLAGEIASAAGDHTRAYPACEAAMRDYVHRSRQLALTASDTLVPKTRLGLGALIHGARILGHLPPPFARTASRLVAARRLNIHDVFTVRDYQGLIRR
ncbi:FAD-dependent oxidoreductase [Mycobacterium sp. CBMA271]|uniref:FAD-dependent monooxygenase n=1 Tax=unclassified Mycobacteroides TaxID=2618759 RepID=UPI0012DF8BA3|nr:MULTISPECIES: FAD-dependent monooxygenase [unclassified Mycobacteroides]MUM18973.1 FAD-dependent oxidoreductase [Mycobacteroides sp. CBMA 326]MUM22850.1 FAD-dependent oxidoreductase [Mycobacteroides sp. CBMA 271]